MSAVYPRSLFWVRRQVRMASKFGPAITKQAERIAINSIDAHHSGAYAVAEGFRFLRQVARHAGAPKDCA